MQGKATGVVGVPAEEKFLPILDFQFGILVWPTVLVNSAPYVIVRAHLSPQPRDTRPRKSSRRRGRGGTKENLLQEFLGQGIYVILGVSRFRKVRNAFGGGEWDGRAVEVERKRGWAVHRHDWIQVHPFSNGTKFSCILQNLTIQCAEQGPLVVRVEATDTPNEKVCTSKSDLSARRTIIRFQRCHPACNSHQEQ
jgi:hypothetical protein